MKSILSIVISAILSFHCCFSTASAQNGFKYQAIIRDAAGNVNANASVQMEISILQGTADGTAVFTETHAVTSNTFGLVNLTIGSQNPSDFNLIDWANGPYFIKISVDGVEFGTSQLLSVPYALHAKSSDKASIAETVENYVESDPLFITSPVAGITQTQIENWTNKLSEFAETDPDFKASVAATISQTQIEAWTNKLDEFLESDPEFAASLAKGITATDTAYWNSKLDEFVESDPAFLAHPSVGITAEDITKWKALFIWYTTNQQGYLKTETQNLADVIQHNKSANNQNISNLADPINAQDAATKAYVDLLELKLDILELKVNINAGVSVADLLASGASVSNLISAGASVSDLVLAGASVSDLVSAGASVSDLVSAGASVSDLVSAGASVSELLAEGFSVSDLVAAGARVSELLAEGFSVSDLVTAGVSVSDLVSAGATTESHYIGLLYEGGIIFHVNVVTGVGLVCAVSDQNTGIQWYNDNWITTGATGTALGTGQSNTTAIVSSQGVGSYAAQLCNDLVLNGYSDWFLPSKDELNKIFENRYAIKVTATANGGSDFNTTSYYWSSTEDNELFAWKQAFVTGYQDNFYKSNTESVRAVRAF